MKTIAGKYEIIRPLGAGGMGSVVEARHNATGRRVAVKVILEEARLEEGVVARFEREARAAGAVESDHITQVLDAGVDAETNAPYLVMELLSGEDVDSLLKRTGPLRPDLALRIVAQMLTGLSRAHEAGIVHRDIKPANVFLVQKESGAVVAKLCDFGIAKVKADPLASGTGHQLTHSAALLGSPTYMSPEQAKGSRDVDARADVWSSGVVLFQLLAGSTPHHEADTLGLLLLAICSTKAPAMHKRAPWVPAEVAAIVARSLELEADERYPSAQAMLDDIMRLLRGGFAIDRSMLTPMTDEERGFTPPVAIAASLALAATDLTPREVVPDLPIKPSPAFDVGTATGGAYTTSAEIRASVVPSPRRMRWVLAAGISVIAVAAGLGFALSGAGPASDTPAAGSSPPIAPSSSSSSSSPPPSSPSASTPLIETDAAPVASAITTAPIKSVVTTARPKPSVTSSATRPPVVHPAPSSSGDEVRRNWQP